MIIVETCPKCGHDLVDEVLTVIPPIPRKSCPKCGWFWEGEPDQVVRVPFREEIKAPAWDDIPPACVGCSNHPSNGGSGICHCMLGSPVITC